MTDKEPIKRFGIPTTEEKEEVEKEKVVRVLTEEYFSYIKSDKWKEKRKEALKKKGNKCSACGITTELDVHHLTYVRFGYELMEDLVIFCRKHHTEVHELKDKGIGNSRYCAEIVIAKYRGKNVTVIPREPRKKSKRKKDKNRFRSKKNLKSFNVPLRMELHPVKPRYRVAQFETTCTDCRLPIKRGTRMKFVGNQMVHLDCQIS